MSLALRLLDPRVEARRTAAIWQSLETAALPPYFLTWAWMANWLDCLPRQQAPQLAVLSDGGRDVAACFLGRRRLLRHGFLPSRALFLNATGVPNQDDLCVEHNAILCAPGWRARAADLVTLIPGDWDELCLPAIDTDAFSDLDEHGGGPSDGDREEHDHGHGASAYRVRVDRQLASPFVDLDRVRAAPDGYLALLGAGTRAQIRRSQRALGPIEVEIAADRSQAHVFLTELIDLHQRSWRARGQPGAFADPWFVRFHARLVDTRFDHGEIQLIRLGARSGTIGCLYNLVGNGRVLFYQSGLRSFDDPHVKPGYLCHATAIEHAARAGHVVYDFLAGNRRYKRSLATDATRLAWIRIQRPRARFAFEDWLRRCKRAALAFGRSAARSARVALPDPQRADQPDVVGAEGEAPPRLDRLREHVRLG